MTARAIVARHRDPGRAIVPRAPAIQTVDRPHRIEETARIDPQATGPYAVFVPVVATIPIAPAPAPSPPPAAPSGLDGPTVCAMGLLGAFTYFAFLREPPRPPPPPDPFASPCPACNPLLMIGMPASEPARCADHEAGSGGAPEPAASPAIVALVTGARG